MIITPNVFVSYGTSANGDQMPRISLHMDTDLYTELKYAADRKNVSLQSFISGVLKEYFNNTWPEEFFGSLGSIDDDTFEVPEELPWSSDSPRDAFHTKMKDAAKEEKSSLSGSVSDVRGEHIEDRWPEGYFGLVGSLKDVNDPLELPEDIPDSSDSPRRAL